MSEETELIYKSREYGVRFPASVIERARDLLWSYLDEQLKSEGKPYWFVTTPDGENMEVKSAEDFYFRHDDTGNTTSSHLFILSKFSPTPFEVMSFDALTIVHVRLPSRTHVDNVLALFAREEQKILASAPPNGTEAPEKQPEGAQKPSRPKLKIFIGHGHNPQWKELRDFLNRSERLETVFYESSSTAGHQTLEVIQTKIKSADMAFLVHTGEDEDKEGNKHARTNVVHEAGMCLTQLGSGRAIVLLEQGCTEYSNINGTDQIRFPKDQLEMKFGEVLLAIEREFPCR